MELKNIYKPIMNDLIQVEAEIKEQIRLLTDEHRFVSEIVRYFFKVPGKRLRPALVLLSAKAVSNHSITQSLNHLIQLATAVELIHGASLIHDDVVDEAVLRRGKPSMNIQFGNQISVIAGDMLYSHAFSILTDRFDRKIMKIFSQCVQRMCRGEINELKECNFEQYLGILKDKTAVFMSACCKAGASVVVGSVATSAVLALADFGLNLGMVYQIVDDLKDGDAPVTGVDRKKLVYKLNEFVQGAEENLFALHDSVYKESIVNLLKYLIEQHREVEKTGSLESSCDVILTPYS